MHWTCVSARNRKTRTAWVLSREALSGRERHRNRRAMPCGKCCERGVHSILGSMGTGEGGQRRPLEEGKN